MVDEKHCHPKYPGANKVPDSLTPNVLEQMWIYFRLTDSIFHNFISENKKDQMMESLQKRFTGDAVINNINSEYYQMYHTIFGQIFKDFINFIDVNREDNVVLKFVLNKRYPTFIIMYIDSFKGIVVFDRKHSAKFYEELCDRLLECGVYGTVCMTELFRMCTCSK